MDEPQLITHESNHPFRLCGPFPGLGGAKKSFLRKPSQFDFKGEIWLKNQPQHYIIRHQREGDLFKVWVEGNGRLDFIVPHTTIVKIKNRSGRIFVQNIQADTLRIETKHFY